MKIPMNEIIRLEEQIGHRKFQIISKKLAHQDEVHLSLFSFDKNESVSQQSNSEDIVIYVLSGRVEVETSQIYTATVGQVLAIPRNTLHRVYSVESSKVFQISTNKGEKEMEKFIQRVVHEEIINMADALEYEKGGVSSLAMVQRSDLTLTLMAFDAGEKIAAHSSNGDALVQVLEGTAFIDIAGKPYQIPAGKSIVMPANISHAVAAEDGPFKMMLTVVKPI